MVLLSELLKESLTESIKISLIIFVMMIIVELFVLKFKNKIIKYLNNNQRKKTTFLPYIIPSFFGIIPGCIGTFAMDSLYMSGLLSFGGLVTTLISTSGDEAFLMLSLAQQGKISWSIIIFLTALLFILGIVGGLLADFFKKKTNMKFCEKCSITIHKDEFNLKHFIKEHILNHIIKKHIWKIFLWIFAALFIISFVEQNTTFNPTNTSNFFILIIASLIAVLPISGPNVFLIIMFSQGMIPFSVLLANSIIQDGHGLLPILGFSLDDAFKLKLFNFLFGFSIGLLLLLLGL